MLVGKFGGLGFRGFALESLIGLKDLCWRWNGRRSVGPCLGASPFLTLARSCLGHGLVSGGTRVCGAFQKTTRCRAGGCHPHPHQPISVPCLFHPKPPTSEV